MMKSMEQIHRVKELQIQQQGPNQITKELKIDMKTVRKYMAKEDFSPQVSVVVTRPSKLDPYKTTIDACLKEDEQNRYKQRHTGKRVYDRLIQKHPEFDCSYPTVNRYVTALKQERKMIKNCFQELQWHPGEAQADFGDCDVILNGQKRTCRFLVLSFPQSNAAFVQCFLGETAECLSQGLMDIF
ncbi:hypothetical protein GC096_11910 [Paenibacillus sp. LMG 31461]|uniref:HTH IS21-type domain-containing protein n=1 Tax=Paenibacillus plantarum TaxID=2654975 RepID=A0ABX1X8H1_9BACL|nr:hypothetical protein [Paenibacillus plantarum]NOU64732.1 hypothetical protein [Paenibacillus plantarum]